MNQQYVKIDPNSEETKQISVLTLNEEENNSIQNIQEIVISDQDMQQQQQQQQQQNQPIKLQKLQYCGQVNHIEIHLKLEDKLIIEVEDLIANKFYSTKLSAENLKSINNNPLFQDINTLVSYYYSIINSIQNPAQYGNITFNDNGVFIHQIIRRNPQTWKYVTIQYSIQFIQEELQENELLKRKVTRLENRIAQMQVQLSGGYSPVSCTFEKNVNDALHTFSKDRKTAERFQGDQNSSNSLFTSAPISCSFKSKFSVRIDGMGRSQYSQQSILIGIVLVFNDNLEPVINTVKHKQIKSSSFFEKLGVLQGLIEGQKNTYLFDNTGQFYGDGEQTFQSGEKFYMNDIVTVCIDAFSRTVEVMINGKKVNSTIRMNPVCFVNCQKMDYYPVITTKNVLDKVTFV